MARFALLLALALGCNSHAEGKPQPAKPEDTARGVPAVGAKAPDGEVARASGKPVKLATLWPAHAKTVLVFYRGFY